MRLYLPESWLERPGAAGQGRGARGRAPAADQGRRSPWSCSTGSAAEGLPGGLVVADAGYGVSGPFRDGLAERGLHYIVGVTDEMVVFTEEPRWDRADGRHRRPAAEAATGWPRARPGR